MKKYNVLLISLLIGFNLAAQTSSTFELDLLLGKKEIPPSAEGYTLLSEVATAFQKMQTAALNDGIEIKIVSSFRSYASQKGIWNKKYKHFKNQGLTGPEAIAKIVEYSTLPGTSRHHWGTDIDIIEGSKKIEGDVLLEKHFHNGPYQELSQWLKTNANSYGFDLVYTQDSLRKGFFYEPWHYSYTPLSKEFLQLYRTQQLISTIKKDSTLLGNEFITAEFLNDYYRDNVLGINPKLLK
ncbi:MAG: M15 family metallopeptidase [Candidatus Arcticimaribacter sp.]